MKHVSHLLMICMILSHPLSATVAVAEDFKLVKQAERVFLYERWLEAGSGEKVRELKAVFLIRSDIGSIVKMLKDPVRGKEWNVHAKMYRIIPLSEENKWISYIQYSIPWPFEDQDCCLTFQYRDNEVSFESTLHSAFPVGGNMTRITGTRGKWVLENMHSGNVRVTYLVTTDRSKRIPRWVSDPIVHNNLIKTMAKFRSLLEE